MLFNFISYILISFLEDWNIFLNYLLNISLNSIRSFINVNFLEFPQTIINNLKRPSKYLIILASSVKKKGT